MDAISSNNDHLINALILPESAVDSSHCELITSCSKMSGIIEKIIPGSTSTSCSDSNVHTRDPDVLDENSLPRFESSPQAFFKKSFIGSGNRCGHNPKVVPQVKPRENQKSASVAFIQKVDARLDDAYLNPRKYLTCVNVIKDRQRRSERREAIIALSKSLMAYFCMETSVIGHYTKKGYFWGPKFEQVAIRTNVSVERLERARAFMVRCKLLEVSTRERRGTSGRFESLPALYQFTPLFFEQLGWDLKDLWRYKESYLKNKRKKRQQSIYLDPPTVYPWAKATLERSAPPRPLPREHSVHETREKAKPSLMTVEDIRNERINMKKAWEMHENDPSKSPQDYYALLRDGPPH